MHRDKNRCPQVKCNGQSGAKPEGEVLASVPPRTVQKKRKAMTHTRTSFLSLTTISAFIAACGAGGIGGAVVATLGAGSGSHAMESAIAAPTTAPAPLPAGPIDSNIFVNLARKT